MNDMAASNPAGILALMEVSPTRAYEQIKETRKRKQHYIQSLTQWTGHFLIEGQYPEKNNRYKLHKKNFLIIWQVLR